MDERQEFLRYYLDELAYLRRMGREFAHLYPKIAARLELANGVSTDPHVERLIESFAFLTARLERRLDSELPEISGSLLGILYPNLVNPVPPLSIARFEVDPAQGKATSGRVLPRHTRLFAQTREGSVCRFRTAYPVELWPVDVVDAGLFPRSAFKGLDSRPDIASVLRLRLEPLGTSFAELELKRLRFHLQGDATVVSALYDLLGQSLAGVAMVPDESSVPVMLPDTAVMPVGFGADDDVIPAGPHSHPGYRLVQEYLQFPVKYHFFDLDGLDRCHATERLDLLFLFRGSPPGRMAIDRDTVVLGCTPIQNLFYKTSEPIRIDHRQAEYRLVADHRREAISEIHSIQSVSAASDPQKPTLEIQPFFSFKHASLDEPSTTFWHARRAATGRADLVGTDVWVSFVDLNFRPSEPPVQVVYAHTLCTNRELAVQIPGGAELQIEDSAPLSRITCLTRPTDAAYPALGGETLWKLVSNLSLNHLSLSNGEQSLAALREMLRLYNFSGSPFITRQIEGIREMHARPVAGQIGSEAWRGFCRGTEVTVVFDESQFVGASPVLFASVLHHFFGLHAAINSFTRVVMKSLQREQEWKRWPPLAGSQPVF
ncbi:MAG TPA: type VI secretion system baseplate subunit TssF [Vicinamibacterales bacterium]|nr:type VI secretion system baseplate subunit TssF [Vicinamibacterales bacterium]